MKDQKKNDKLQKLRVWQSDLGCSAPKGTPKCTKTSWKTDKTCRKCFNWKSLNRRRGYWMETFSPLSYDKYKKTQKGDSGSPLYCKIDGKWKSFGVSSFGVSGKNPHRNVGGIAAWGVPFPFIDWIKEARYYGH